ncbi:MAG: hypothetical protein HC838_06480 [Spirulinaceae cyanobacterium RM2_2_10]|nr:hypothetical protein [Spirulinaceae cyanobacterium RM2_2_10]
MRPLDAIAHLIQQIIRGAKEEKAAQLEDENLVALSLQYLPFGGRSLNIAAGGLAGQHFLGDIDLAVAVHEPKHAEREAEEDASEKTACAIATKITTNNSP